MQTDISNQLPIIATGEIGGNLVRTVDARELHRFLEVGKDFSTWIKDRIQQYNFEQNQDYVCSPILGSKGRGGHNRISYHLTIDMAKELSMVERTAKGKEARLYFIECEKRLTQFKSKAHQLLAMSQAVVDHEERISQLATTQTQMAIKQENQQQQINSISQRQDAMSGDTGYVTVLALLKMRGFIAPSDFARNLGVKAAKECRDLGYEIGKVADERYGSVNSYPVAILEECFDNLMAPRVPPPPIPRRPPPPPVS